MSPGNRASSLTGAAVRAAAASEAAALAAVFFLQSALTIV